ncbi:serine hydrolase domain-containing protein [Sedimentitalea todarodis]|uniref:Serine hydrolase n=1 Tax=Sedimentitalea todarodis TaxID=1631240 RepID=A0ABU3VD06_9RHOB|nr:serine hydrolase [Sedimentitalea todarodis]MDU9004058.1 serine hydrolase [Sedimentitalea todarodis]
MRTLGKWLGRILLSLLLAAAVIGVWKREEITRLWAVNSLFSEERIVGNFSHMDAAFLTAPLPRGDGPVSPLPEGEPARLPDDTEGWIKARTLTSLLVMKDGTIRYEDYFLGTRPDDRRISWSIAKSYLSALFGVLLDEGAIESLGDPVTRYAPELTGSAYDGASIRNVLTMASGVTFDEDIMDPNSDINRMGRIIALGGTLDDFTASFVERFSAPGAVWKYVSIDTHVVGLVIRGATGRSVTELLAEKIIAPLGQEQDAYYLTDGAGVAFVLGGLNLTTRDYARFGQMILQNGDYNGQQVIPADWVAASTAPTAPTAPGKDGYGYLWWSPEGGVASEFMGRGAYGQYLYIDQARNVVIVATAADRTFREDGINDDNIAMFRRIADGL